MDDKTSWIIALSGAVVGSAITIISQVISDKIKKYGIRRQLLKHLEIEISTHEADEETSNFPTIISRYILLSNILDPIKDKDLIKKLTKYISITRDYDKSIIGNNDIKTLKKQLENKKRELLNKLKFINFT